MYNMKFLENNIRNVFIDRGVMLSNWRIKIVGCESVGAWSDWAIVSVDVYRKYSKKADWNYQLAINTVRGIIDWDQSTWCSLKGV